MFEIKDGDSLDVLKTIPPESVQCIITSPPYYGLRDYGHEDAIGLEESLDDYLERLLAVLGECKRILKPEGTLWLNLGDSYAGSGRGAGSTDGTIQGTSKGTHGLNREKPPVVCEHGVAQAQGRRDHRIFEDGIDTGRKCYIAMSKPTRADYKLDPSSLQANSRGSLKAPQVKGSAPVRRKSLLGVPWRIALQMIDDGWILRSDTIWAKKGPMPESVKDRPTRAHEYCFMFTKSEKYLYNWLDVAEPMKVETEYGMVSNGAHARMLGMQSSAGGLYGRKEHMAEYHGDKGYSRYASDNPNDKASKAFADADKRRYHDATKVKYPHADPDKKVKEDARKRKHHAATKVGGTAYNDPTWQKKFYDIKTRHLSTEPKRNKAKAGYPPVNGSIGAVGGLQTGRRQDSGGSPAAPKIPYRDGIPVRNRWSYQIVESSSSYEGHYALFPVSSIIPLVLASSNEGDTVLDPFSGMATTGLAAIRHNRNYIGIEINPEYAETSRQRLIDDAPLLNMNA